MTTSTSTKRFLGQRKAGTADRFARHVREAIDDWSELKLKTALGMEFRQTGRVVLARPWWLPRSLYRRLLRTVVIETKDVVAR